MRSVVQRVCHASVSVEGSVSGCIGKGLLVYLGAARGDGPEDVAYMAEKIASLRIFPDEEGRMNRSIQEAGGAVLAVSQFTLLADARKGRRPSYSNAEEAGTARGLYDLFMAKIREQGLICQGGVFQAHMEVESLNDGPVTILLDSRRVF